MPIIGCFVTDSMLILQTMGCTYKKKMVDKVRLCATHCDHTSEEDPNL